MLYLIRQNTIWHFRRRVPRKLREWFPVAEIYRSLNTTCKMEAKRRAAHAFLQTETLFSYIMSKSENKKAALELTDAEIRGAVRLYMQANSIWQDRIQEIRTMGPGPLYHRADQIAESLSGPTFTQDMGPGEGPRRLDMQYECISVLDYSDYNGFAETDENLARVERMIAAEVRRHIDQRRSELFGEEIPNPSSAITNQPETSPSPLFTEKLDAYRKTTTYSQQSHQQNDVTFRLWTELCGNRSTREYTEVDAESFKAQLMRLPASHGKGEKLHANDAIAAAEGKEVRRLSQKTIKRHFSALSQYWVWLKQSKHVDTNIFLGFSFKVKKSLADREFPGRRTTRKNCFILPVGKKQNSTARGIGCLSLRFIPE